MKRNNSNNELQTLKSGDLEAIRHLQEAILGGKHWYVALLEAMAIWKPTEEDCDGCHYNYLVGGEAFDWLLLAERLCQEVDGLIPEEEMRNLLLCGKPPLEFSPAEFKRLIGDTKYDAYLNYVYGVLVEGVLVLAVEEEVRKEHQAGFFDSDDDIQREVYKRVYGTDLDSLLRAWREERDHLSQETVSLAEMKEFTYWLFQYRVRRCEKARVASDTKKALCYLRRQGGEGFYRWETGTEEYLDDYAL